MKKSFTIQRTDTTATDEKALMAEIVNGTGSETEAASVFRSLQRLGTDEGILFYEMTQVTKGPRLGGVSTSAWRVRADRGRPVVDPDAVVEGGATETFGIEGVEIDAATIAAATIVETEPAAP